MAHEKAHVAAGYRCPLYPDHADDEFVVSRIVGAPICEGCAIEISHFIEADERPDDLVLDRLEATTGLSFPEYQKLAFEELVDDLAQRLLPENIDREVEYQRRITGQSREEVVDHWKTCVETYNARIRRLADGLT